MRAPTLKNGIDGGGNANGSEVRGTGGSELSDPNFGGGAANRAASAAWDAAEGVDKWIHVIQQRRLKAFTTCRDSGESNSFTGPVAPGSSDKASPDGRASE